MKSLISVFIFLITFSLKAEYLEIRTKEKMDEYTINFLKGFEYYKFDKSVIFGHAVKLKAFAHYRDIIGEKFDNVVKMTFIKELGQKYTNVQLYDYSRNFLKRFESESPRIKEKLLSPYHKWFIDKLAYDLFLIGKSPSFSDLQIKMDTLSPSPNDKTLKFKRKTDLIFNWGTYVLSSDIIDIKNTLDSLLITSLEKILLNAEILSGLTYNKVLSIVIKPGYRSSSIQILVNKGKREENKLINKVKSL